MRAGIIRATALGALLSSNPAFTQPVSMIDGHRRPERTRVTYRWVCSSMAIQLGYWEEFP